MADIKSPTERYKAIADAIRKKNGTTELMHPADMPQAILDIVSGGGTNYESIVYNEDNTITLSDKDGTEHIITCEYADDKLIGITYDGESIELAYEGNVLKRIGSTAVDLENLTVYGGGDYTEAYNLMTKEMPVEDTESGVVDYIGALVGVNANDNN